MSQPGGRSTETEQAFLDVEPPHWAIRGLAYVLILLFMGAAVTAAVVQVPETVDAPFLLVPTSGADPVRALREGTVTSVLVNDGQLVKAGDVLLVIESQV